MGKIQPGQVLNPRGRNQYTYRAEAEASLERYCKDHADQVIERVVLEAESGQPWAVKLLLDRILPAKHEVEVSSDPDVAGLCVAIENFARHQEQVAQVGPPADGDLDGLIASFETDSAALGERLDAMEKDSEQLLLEIGI